MVDEIELEEVGEDPETGTPIFKMSKENGSSIVFHFDDWFEGVTVLYVASRNKGDMKQLVDKVVTHFGEDYVMFFNVMNQKLVDALDAFEEDIVVINNEKVRTMTGTWEVRK